MGPCQLQEVPMRLHGRLGAVVIAGALALTGSATTFADETPGTQRDAFTAVNTAVIHVEGMT
jgi:hypothetical protein